MSMRVRFLKRVIWPVLMIFAFACADRTESPLKPVEVHLGEDTCSTCGMIISNEHFGAQGFASRSPALFDDVGCLLKSSSRDDIKSIFVRSFEDGRWIPAEQSFAVTSNQIQSPMGYGIATFPTEQAAREFASRFPDATVLQTGSLLKNPPNK